MRPLAVLNAIVFGSATAITFGLCGVLIIFLVLQGRHPELTNEFPSLTRSAAMFIVLTVVSGLSLLGTLKGQRWRLIAQAAMWVTIAGTILLYWPR
ncbi:MAG TPA: hypothetical protein VGN07_09125 [Steroidobacteraceae bacterium]|jgi:hypothetical protein